MADKKPIDPKKPSKRSAKVVRNLGIVAGPALTDPPAGLLKKNLYTWKIPGLLLLVGGGVLAGSIGFFAAILFEYFDTSDPLAPLLHAQNELYEKLETQSAQIDSIKSRPVLVDLSGPLSALGITVKRQNMDIKALWAAHADQFEAMSQRINLLEERPITEGVSLLDIASYERQLAQLQDDVSKVANYATSKIEQAEAMAEVLETKTVKLSTNGRAISALKDIWVAVENGLGFDRPLAELVAVIDLEVAPSLVEIAPMGIVSLSVLQSQFPAAARAALKLARQEKGLEEGESRILAFLKAQLGVRSLRAKDGASADAILSRALVAVDRGDLELAVSEILELPNSSKLALQGWSKAAVQRLMVLTALQKLTTALTGN